MSRCGPNNYAGRSYGRHSNRHNGCRGRGRGFSRNRNQNSNKIKALPEQAPPPLTYFSKEDKKSRVKVTWKRRNAKEEEKLPVYDNTSLEDYIHTLTDFYSVLDENDALKEDAKVEKCVKIMRKYLKKSAKTSFLEAIKECSRC